MCLLLSTLWHSPFWTLVTFILHTYCDDLIVCPTARYSVSIGKSTSLLMNLCTEQCVLKIWNITECFSSTYKLCVWAQTTSNTPRYCLNMYIILNLNTPNSILPIFHFLKLSLHSNGPSMYHISATLRTGAYFLLLLFTSLCQIYYDLKADVDQLKPPAHSCVSFSSSLTPGQSPKMPTGELLTI